MKQTISRKKAKKIFEANAVLVSKNSNVMLPWGAAADILGEDVIKRVLDEPMRDEAKCCSYWLYRRSESDKPYTVLTKRGFLKAVAYYNESIIEQML